MNYPVGHNRSLMIFLLVAHIVRVGHCSPADELTPAAADSAPAAADSATPAADPATTAADSAASAAAAGQPPPANEAGKPSTFSKCKTELYKSISSLGRGAGMLMKAFSQAALTVLGLFIGSYDTITSTTAATGERVAGVVDLVNGATGKLVLVRDVTGGAAKLVKSLTDTFRKNADFNIDSRGQMIDTLDTAIDEYRPESEAYLMPQSAVAGGGGADGKTTDATPAAAAAPPTDDAGRTTATATPPVTS